MTSKTVEENLRQVEEFIENHSHSVHITADGLKNLPSDDYQKAKEALSSLRSLMSGDAGEDEKIIRKELIFGMSLCAVEKKSIKLQDGFRNALAALSRLSARAKLGEAEIREAKKRVLEEVKYKYGHFLASEEDLGVHRPIRLESVLERELAALDREAGRE